MKTYTLSDFIAYYGDERAARLFGAAKRTVASWRRRERVPKPSMAQHIVSITEGAVSFDGIYGISNPSSRDRSPPPLDHGLCPPERKLGPTGD